MKPNRTTHRVRISAIPDIRKALQTLAKTSPDELSLRAAIRELYAEIKAARAAEHDYDTIAHTLRNTGIMISASTLASYFRDEMQARATAKAGAKAPVIAADGAKQGATKADVPSDISAAARPPVPADDIDAPAATAPPDAAAGARPPPMRIPPSQPVSEAALDELAAIIGVDDSE